MSDTPTSTSPINIQERGIQLDRMDRLGQASCELMVQALEAEEKGLFTLARNLHTLSVACANKQRALHKDLYR